MGKARALRVFRTLWRWYCRRLDNRPLFTQAATTGVVCGVGDSIAQILIEHRELGEYDLHRTVRMTSIGLFFTVSNSCIPALCMHALCMLLMILL